MATTLSENVRLRDIISPCIIQLYGEWSYESDFIYGCWVYYYSSSYEMCNIQDYRPCSGRFYPHKIVSIDGLVFF